MSVIEALQGLETILKTEGDNYNDTRKRQKSKSFFMHPKTHSIPTEPNNNNNNHLPFVTKIDFDGKMKKDLVKIPYLNTFVKNNEKNNKLLNDFIDSHLKKTQLFPIKKENKPAFLAGTPQKNYYLKTPLKTKRKDEELKSRNKSAQR